MTGDTDKDFTNIMIEHHPQAIAMAQAQLKHGKDPQIRRAAERMISDSQRDIAELQKWRDQHGGLQSTGSRQ